MIRPAFVYEMTPSGPRAAGLLSADGTKPGSVDDEADNTACVQCFRQARRCSTDELTYIWAPEEDIEFDMAYAWPVVSDSGAMCVYFSEDDPPKLACPTESQPEDPLGDCEACLEEYPPEDEPGDPPEIPIDDDPPDCDCAENQPLENSYTVSGKVDIYGAGWDQPPTDTCEFFNLVMTGDGANCAWNGNNVFDMCGEVAPSDIGVFLDANPTFPEQCLWSLFFGSFSPLIYKTEGRTPEGAYVEAGPTLVNPFRFYDLVVA